MSYSDDYGRSWRYLSEPAAEAEPVNGLWEPFLRNARDGSLQIYYSHELAGNDQDTIERFSTDDGHTWSTPSTISGTGIVARDGMAGVDVIAGSALIIVFESTIDGRFAINSITSDDDGVTWGNRQHVYTAPTGRNAGAPQVINVGGTLVVSFITDEDSEKVDTVYTRGISAKIVISPDQGITWGQKWTVGRELSVWSGLVDLGESSFLMMFDHGGAVSQKIALQ